MLIYRIATLFFQSNYIEIWNLLLAVCINGCYFAIFTYNVIICCFKRISAFLIDNFFIRNPCWIATNRIVFLCRSITARIIFLCGSAANWSICFRCWGISIWDVKLWFFHIPIKSSNLDICFCRSIHSYDIYKFTFIIVYKFYSTITIYHFLCIVFHTIKLYGSLFILNVHLADL